MPKGAPEDAPSTLTFTSQNVSALEIFVRNKLGLFPAMQNIACNLPTPKKWASDKVFLCNLTRTMRSKTMSIKRQNAYPTTSQGFLKLSFTCTSESNFFFV